jgi:DNA-binding NarL/FixJ family response regulator
VTIVSTRIISPKHPKGEASGRGANENDRERAQSGEEHKIGMAVMRHEWTLRRQRSTSSARADTLEERGGSILYLDERHLTRECIGRELARRLPEFTIIERATARDLASGDLNLGKIALVILYVHADRATLRADPGAQEQGDGIATQLSILEDIAPETPRVLMSEVEVPEDILEAFRRRVRGYVPTTLPMKQVAEAIRFVAAGGTFVPQSILSWHGPAHLIEEDSHCSSQQAALTDFSPRQNEVLRMLWNGSSNKVIAYELHMSESTVKVHIRHIMKKLNVSNRTQVVLRTRPQRIEREFHAGTPSLHSVLRDSTAVAPSVGRSIHGQMTNGVPDVSKATTAHHNSHRG